MKKTILTLAMVAVLSTNAFARQQPGEMSLNVSGTVSWVALSAFAPVAAGALLVSVTTGGATLWSVADETVRKQVQELVNNDAQQYYNNGTISPALENSINHLKSLDKTLTDGDAVDMLVEAVNN